MIAIVEGSLSFFPNRCVCIAYSWGYLGEYCPILLRFEIGNRLKSNCRVDPPTPLGDGVPRAIADPIMACLARDPGERPAPAELLGALELLLDTLPKPWLSKLKPRR